MTMLEINPPSPKICTQLRLNRRVIVEETKQTYHREQIQGLTDRGYLRTLWYLIAVAITR